MFCGSTASDPGSKLDDVIGDDSGHSALRWLVDRLDPYCGVLLMEELQICKGAMIFDLTGLVWQWEVRNLGFSSVMFTYCTRVRNYQASDDAT